MKKQQHIYGLWRDLAFALILVVLLSRTTSAQSDNFDDFFDEANAAFDSFAQSMDGQYDAFVAEQERRFNEFVAQVDQVWDDRVYPARKNYVEYSDSFHSRVHVDFEKGEVEASVLMDISDTLAALREARRRLTAKLAQSVTNPGRTEPYATTDSVPPAPGPPLLEDQLVDQAGTPVTAETAEEFAEEVVQTAGISVDTVIAQDGKRRIKLSTTCKLVPDHLKKRATKYLPVARTFAEQQKLDLRLVLAIMHTESYFNPRATSQIPAYGLMQVVPATARRGAYKARHGQDKLGTAEYLYDPRNNIEMGAVYLHIVRYRYLKGIDNNQTAYPCLIASYNGGIGTVCKALSGTKSLGNLAKAVNGLDYPELVQRLNRELPYKETRDYLKRVLERMPLYDEWAQ